MAWGPGVVSGVKLSLAGPFGVHEHVVTSVAQVNKHLQEYSWRVLMVKAKPGQFPDPELRRRQLYAACDQLLDAGLMLRAVAQWERASWTDLDVAELGVVQVDEPSEVATA